MELSKTVALTALLFIVVLIFTSAISFSAEGEESINKVADFTPVKSDSN